MKPSYGSAGRQASLTRCFEVLYLEVIIRELKMADVPLRLSHHPTSLEPHHPETLALVIDTP